MLEGFERRGMLFVSVNTIESHLKHIYRKLEAEDRSSAIARAEALHLLR
jgi:LuxR family maltose regulon positive regulatory protein